MLTTVDHGDVAGISGVEWDAVELPSQVRVYVFGCLCACVFVCV